MIPFEDQNLSEEEMKNKKKKLQFSELESQM
jgi:hypothetical protein